MEGLLTTKWELRGDNDTAAEYAKGEKLFVHKQLPLGEATSSEAATFNGKNLVYY